MRKYLLILIMPLFFLQINKTFSQITLTNDGQLTINNNQLVHVEGHIVNKSSLFSNSGDLRLTGNFWNEATVNNTGNGILRFVGGQAQTFFLIDSMEVFNLEIDNPSGLSLTGDFSLAIYNETTFLDGLVTTNQLNLMAFQADATHSFANDSSHVNGPATKSGVSSFTFPIGKGGRYRPSGIESVTATTTFISEYFNFSHFDLTTDETIYRVSDEEYWNLDRKSGLGNAIVLFSYDETIGGFDDIEDVQLGYFDNPWTRVESMNTGASPTFFASNNTVSKFGHFTFVENKLDQPAVMLEVFQRDDCAVQLDWIIPPGTRAVNFEIEISFDSLTYTKIGEVAGDSLPYTSFEILQYLDYELYDEELLTYRVKVIQPGGAIYYTNAVTIENKCIFKHCSLFPNPVSSTKNINLRMTSEFDQVLSIKIYDVPGRILAEQELEIKPGNRVYEIYTADLDLPSAMYFLQITPRKSLKFVVIYD
ncbi:MAG: T9SS type A sorting domain-containing protein [Saprospiraceae bacterium]